MNHPPATLPERRFAALRRAAMAVLLLAAAWLALAPRPAQAITTPEILTKTITSYPSCLKYQVKGVCFFLKCGWTGCSIRTSIRIEHYVPDAIVSTYHEPLQHPWTEIGKPLSAAMSSVGTAMLGVPLPVDSSAMNQREASETETFKSADAIGNPAGLIMQLFLTNTIPNLPDVFGLPGTQELAKFPSQELPQIQSAWAGVPMQVGNQILSGARALANAPGEILGFIAGLPGKLSQMQSAIGNVGQVMQTGVDIGNVMSAAQIAGIDLGPIRDIVGLAQSAGGGWALGQLFCPGSASAFTLHFQSDLDSYFWREMIPVELLYPQSWVPGMDEVSKSPVNTWGGRYPRTGHLVQSHGVKASAVLAERVGSIIKKEAQPHIYKRLEPGSGFKYFDTLTDTRWQMLSPSSTGCVSFGDNDSLSLTSWGDGKTDPAEGYVWNMWNKYDCCQKRGSFLFSIP